MPRKHEMTWDGAPNYRWKKLHKGERYCIKCADLSLPKSMWTKEGSYQAANEWWRQKKAEIVGPPPAKQLIDDMSRDVDALGEAVERGAIARAILNVLPLGIEEDSEAELEAAVEKILGFEPREDLKLEFLAQIKAKLGQEIETDKALEKQAERFLALEEARMKKPGTFGDLADYIRKLIDWGPLRKGMNVERINEAVVTDFYGWLRKSSGQCNTVQKKIWSYFRRLVKFLWSERIIDLPRNIENRTFSFPSGAKKIKEYPIEVVRSQVKELPRRLKLYALLALNCGMYGVDMAQMKLSEYKDGRIRRKRTKTEDKNVPEVDYLLWPETKELLDSYPPTHETFYLTSKTNTVLWEERIENGKKKEKDLIKQQWKRGRGKGKERKPRITLKAFRSISATIIESHRHYGRYKSHFLGQSPRGIAEKHYAAPSMALFDEIILWLREQILGTAEEAGKER